MFPCPLLCVLPWDLLWLLRCQKVSNDGLSFPWPFPSCVAKFCELPECIAHSCIRYFLVLKYSLLRTPSRQPLPHCQGSFSFWAMPTHSLIEHQSRIIFPNELPAAFPPTVPPVFQGNTLFLHLLSGLLVPGFCWHMPQKGCISQTYTERERFQTKRINLLHDSTCMKF